jgi:hypothetical protein
LKGLLFTGKAVIGAIGFFIDIILEAPFVGMPDVVACMYDDEGMMWLARDWPGQELYWESSEFDYTGIDGCDPINDPPDPEPEDPQYEYDDNVTYEFIDRTASNKWIMTLYGDDNEERFELTIRADKQDTGWSSRNYVELEPAVNADHKYIDWMIQYDYEIELDITTPDVEVYWPGSTVYRSDQTTRTVPPGHVLLSVHDPDYNKDDLDLEFYIRTVDERQTVYHYVRGTLNGWDSNHWDWILPTEDSESFGDWDFDSSDPLQEWPALMAETYLKP